MRKTKFRAWHKGNNGFIYETLEGIWKNGFIVAQAYEHHNSKKIERKEGSIYATDKFLNKTEAFYVNSEWEQYIGLEDKNDKEIYKDDIAKYKNDTYIIKWRNELSGFKLWNGTRFYPIHDSMLPDLIIIGNKYENPELLKEYNLTTKNKTI